MTNPSFIRVPAHRLGPTQRSQTFAMSHAKFLSALRPALLAYLPVLVLIGVANYIDQPLALVLLLLANTLSMASITYATGFAGEEQLRHLLTRRGPAWLVLFTLLSALVWLLIALPTLALAASPSLMTMIAMASALVLALAFLWPLWPAFALVFVWDDAAGEAARRVQIFTVLKRCILFAWRLRRQCSLWRHFLPSAMGLLLLVLGALMLSSTYAIVPQEFRTLNLWLYGIVILPLVDVVLINRILQVLLGRSTETQQVPPAHAAHAQAAATASAPQMHAVDALSDAIRAADDDTVRQQLQTGVDSNQIVSNNGEETTPLMLAATGGHLSIVRLLIEHGVNINQAVAGNTALTVVCAHQDDDHTAIVATLLANGADCSHADDRGNTALHYAAMHGNLDDAARLLDAGATPEARNRAQLTPLALACEHSRWDMARWLLTHGAKAEQDSAALIRAARNGEDDPTGVDLLLARRAPMDAVNQQQRTALMEAAAQRNLHIVNRLIDAGADIAQADKHGITALMEAARQGATSIVQALLDADVDIHARDAHDRDALMLAAGSSRSSVETISALVHAGADPQRKNRQGRSAIDAAQSADRHELLAALGTRDAAPLPPADDIIRHDPQAHLLDALRFGHWHIVHQYRNQMPSFDDATKARFYTQLCTDEHLAAQYWLLDNGLNPNSTLATGESLLHAVMQQLPDSLSAVHNLLLQGVSPAGSGLFAMALEKLAPYPRQGLPLAFAMLDKGADPFAPNAQGKTPLHLATASGWEPLLRTLLHMGINPNQRDRNGQSPLYAALTQARPEINIIRQLVAAGANPELAHANGETPLGLAIALDQPKLKRWLQWDIWPLPGRRLRADDLPAAAMRGDLDAVKKLLELGFPVDSVDVRGASALIHAAAQGETDLIEALLAADANPRFATPEGITPLLAAVNTCHLQIVQHLLDLGGNPNECMRGGISALMIACSEGYTDVARLLLERGAQVNHVDSVGRCALGAAAQYCFTNRDSLRCHRLLSLLIEAGANPNLADASGLTPLLHLLGAHAKVGTVCDATHLGALIPILLDANAHHATADKQGLTALHACAKHALLSPARVLLARGADRSSKDAAGRRPADLARELGYVDVALELGER